MNISKEIKNIKLLLGMSDVELANSLGVSFDTILLYGKEDSDIKDRDIEEVYEYAFKKGIRLNLIKTQLLKEDFENNDTHILFHGSKKSLSFPLDFKHSKTTNDFGVGFYLGETFIQASSYIANYNKRDVYAFSIQLKNLKVKRYSVDEQWMLTIASYRGMLEEYKDTRLIKDYISEAESCDVIIAPIADNNMFEIIEEYVKGLINDEQCKHALSATDLGYQYVIKSENALKKLKCMDRLYVSQSELDEAMRVRIDNYEVSQDKVKLSRIEYKSKGKYIDEVLK